MKNITFLQGSLDSYGVCAPEDEDFESEDPESIRGLLTGNTILIVADDCIVLRLEADGQLEIYDGHALLKVGEDELSIGPETYVIDDMRDFYQPELDLIKAQSAQHYRYTVMLSVQT